MMNKNNFTYRQEYDGRIAVALEGAQVQDGNGGLWDANAGDSATCTGYVYRESNVHLLQTTSGFYVMQNVNRPTWELREGKKVAEKSERQAQAVVDKMIANNRHILQNNLFCARFAYKLSNQEKQRLYNLQYRLEERDALLKNDTFIRTATTSSPAGYSALLPYLKQVMNRWNNGEVGIVITTTALIIISAIVVASVATAAYFAFKSYAEESAEDVKFSDDLTKTLMTKLTPEEYDQVKQETKGIVTKARLKERLRSSSKYIMLGAAAIVVGLLYYNQERE